jgi:chromosome segregation ATPase
VLAVNKQSKGGVINIYPLETMNLIESKKITRLPNPSEAKPISDFCKLKGASDPRLAPLVHNMLHKVFMVKDYQLAMEIAKDFNLTCVTPDLQVVYAGAFITKVGHS